MMNRYKYVIGLVVFLLLLPFLPVAQSYQPIPDSNAYWIIEEGDGGPGHFYFTYSLSETLDDTLINNVTYIKLFCGNPLNQHFCGAFRNATNGKSFYVPKYSEQEYVLRDFSKNAGDTVKNVAYDLEGDTWVLDFYVDTTGIATCESTNYKVMYLSTVIEDTIPGFDSDEPLVWIEKIGSIGGGILNAHSLFMAIKDLYCMQDNDTIYHAYLVNNHVAMITCENGICVTPTSIDESGLNEYEIQVSPNPFRDFITINNLPHNIPIELGIFNQLGQLVFQKNLLGNQPQQRIKINTTLQAGLYIIKIQSKNTVLFTHKIVKK